MLCCKRSCRRRRKIYWGAATFPLVKLRFYSAIPRRVRFPTHIDHGPGILQAQPAFVRRPGADGSEQRQTPRVGPGALTAQLTPAPGGSIFEKISGFETARPDTMACWYAR